MHFNLVYLAVIVGSVAVLSVVGAATLSSTAELAEFAAATPTQDIGLAVAASAATTYDNIGDSDGAGAGDANLDGGNVEFSAIPQLSSNEITPCSLNEPSRNDCIKGLFKHILPKLKDGMPALNMASIDPYFYTRGIFRYANDGIQGGLLIKNMQINGISTLRVNNLLSNFTEQGFIVKLSAEIPKLTASGHFKADVKFGGLRLVPKGLFNITIDNIKATVLTDGALETTELGQRVKLNRLNANVAIGKAHITANGIFSDSNLNTMILNLVNENLPEITRVGIPATREQWAPILVAHINDFFANVPIEKLLLQ